MHFDVWVMVAPGSESEMYAAADVALDPFDMEAHWRRTELPCICVGQAAEAWGREEAKRDLPEVHHAVGAGHDQAYSEALAAAQTPEERTQAAMDNHARYLAHVKPLEARLRAAAEEYARRHPLYAQPAPGCPWCSGVGHVVEEMNPDGHYDYYTVTAVTSATDLIAQGAGAYAIVADGQWHEAEVTLGATREERDEAARAWTRRVRELLATHRDHAVVIVDCHG